MIRFLPWLLRLPPSSHVCGLTAPRTSSMSSSTVPKACGASSVWPPKSGASESSSTPTNVMSGGMKSVSPSVRSVAGWMRRTMFCFWSSFLMKRTTLPTIS